MTPHLVLDRSADEPTLDAPSAIARSAEIADDEPPTFAIAEAPPPDVSPTEVGQDLLWRKSASEEAYTLREIDASDLHGVTVVVCAPEQLLPAAQHAYRLVDSSQHPVLALNRRWPVRLTRQHRAVLGALWGNGIPAYEIPYSGASSRPRRRRTKRATPVALPSNMKEMLHAYADHQ